MAAKVGERLNHDPMKLRFTTTGTIDGKAKSVVKRGPSRTIAAIIPLSYIASYQTVMLYEKLDESIIDLELKRNLKVTWTGIHNKERSTCPLSMYKVGTVGELIEKLSEQVQLTPTGTGRIRVFKVGKDGETREELTAAVRIGNIPDPVELIAEEIPPEEAM